MRNYTEFWGGRLILGGNYQSIVGTSSSDVDNQAQFYITNFGYAWSLRPFKAYFLGDKDNVIGLLKTWIAHHPAAFGSAYVFLQDGLRALASPRETWSNGE